MVRPMWRAGGRNGGEDWVQGGDAAAARHRPPLSFSSLLSSLELGEATIYEPCIRALLGTASYLCEVVAQPETGEKVVGTEEKMGFKAETQQLLDIVTHSLYTVCAKGS